MLPDLNWSLLKTLFKLLNVHQFIFLTDTIFFYSHNNLLKKVRNAVLGCNLKHDWMISVHFQGKAFNISAIQVYASTSNAEEAEVEGFYVDLQELLELTLQKDILFIIGTGMQK